MAEHNKSQDQSMEAGFQQPKTHFYTELTRIVTGMYVGVLALMTFLLTVGFQRPHNDFKYALYTTITVLTLNLLAYLAGHLFFLKHLSTPKDEVTEDKNGKDKESSATTKPVSAWEKSRRQLRIMRLVQQVLFVLAVLSIAWLAIATAQFFFTIPTTQPSGGGTSPQ